MLLARFRITATAALVALAIVIVEAAKAATLPFPIGAQQGVFLHVSDIHFNPFDDPTLLPQLVKAPVDQWESIFETSSHKHFAQYGKDANFPLFMSMLSAAKGLPYDYVLNTGDDLAHKFRTKFKNAGGKPGDYEGFVIKTLRFVNHMLATRFPGVPVVYALGNNDAVCGDYRVAPDSKMLAQVGGDLPLVAGNPQALRDFKSGGYYLVPHPTVPDHDIIVLNSVFWSAKYRDNCSSQDGKPGAAELAWLKQQLAHEKAAGRTASLAMHIPPGIDAYSSSHHSCLDGIVSFWQTADTSRFLALVAADKSVVHASYAGHTHMDDFRVLSGKNGTPFLTTRMTPSVSPVFGNNPAFTVLLYSRTDASVSNYATFYLSNLKQAGAGEPAKWRLEYAFAKTYGPQGYTPAHIATLAKNIRDETSVRNTFGQHYAVEAPSSAFKPGNWLTFACAQTAVTRTAYAACRCP